MDVHRHTGKISYPRSRLLNPLQAYTESVKHNTVHRIQTSGPPVFCSPRRLSPDKYKLAKAEFQHMLDLGIVRASSSTFASPLNMVPKTQSRIGDPLEIFDVLTVPDKYIATHHFMTIFMKNYFVQEHALTCF